MVSFCGVLAASEPEIVIRETGIFQALVRLQGLVKGESVYLLDQREGRISVYDLDGRLVNKFGSLGQGPGEFNRAALIFDLGDQGIGILDLKVIHRFTDQGVFVERIPHKGNPCWKVATGWVWASKGYYFYPDRGQLFIGGPRFEDEAVIAAWGEADNVPEGIPDLSRGLPRERTDIEVSPDGERLFVHTPFSSEIQILDVRKRVVVRTLKLDVAPVPYDETHWEETQAELAEYLKVRGMVHQKREMPDYYPLVAGMGIGFDGILNVSAHDPKNPRKLRHWYFTQNGEPSEPGLSSQATARIIGLREDQAWVILFSEEKEEVEIARCPLGLVNEFVTQHPIYYDW